MRKNIPWNARTESATEDTQSDHSWNHIDLRPGEKVLHEYRESALWPTINMAVIVFGVIVLMSWYNIWVILFAASFVEATRWATHENRWALTNQRVLERTGVGNKKATSVDRTRITDVSVERPWFNPILRRGKVKINTAGRSGDEIVMSGMADPDAVAAEISR